MRISGKLLEDLLAHTQEDPRNEICGVVAVACDGAEPGSRTAVSVHRAGNLHASPLRFEIEPMELYKLNGEIEDSGGELGGIYHSHVRSDPYPSQTDINYAAGWPGVEWIIVGLAGAEPVVRSYLIEGGRVTEVALEES
jgi:[CysO sulfur-carrier protein]-S-L-cysteine hydrolase